jgi:hypothetical protein
MDWINKGFAPTLSFDAAVISLAKLKQTESAINYNLTFNSLVNTIQQTDAARDDKLYQQPICNSGLCVFYREG